MAYPILAPKDTWYTQGGTSIAKSTITSITIRDTYTPAAAVTARWDGSAERDGSITVYVEGTALTIAGNGSGKIMANADSETIFSDADYRKAFTNLAIIKGLELLDTSGVTTFRKAFSLAAALRSLDLSTFDMSKVTSIRGMLQGTTNLDALDVTGWQLLRCTDASHFLFYVPGTENVKLTTLDLTGWNTPALTDLSTFCKDFKGLKTAKLSSLDVSKVTTMSRAFSGCENLEHLDIAGWQTSSLADVSFMFWGPHRFTRLDLSGWDVSKVQNFDHFLAHNSNATVTIDGWHVTSACKHVGAMFHSIKNDVIDISGWDMSNVTTTNQMFENCANLTHIIGIEKMAAPKNISLDEMFRGCSKMKSLDLSMLDTRSARDGDLISENGGVAQTCLDLFGGMVSLERITLGANFAYNGDGTGDPSHYASLPVPNVPGWDGNWYDQSGRAFTPQEAPKHVPAVYFATKDLARNEPVTMRNGTMMDIGEAVRVKKSDNIYRKPGAISQAIMEISSGSDKAAWEYLGTIHVKPGDLVIKSAYPDGTPYDFSAICVELQSDGPLATADYPLLTVYDGDLNILGQADITIIPASGKDSVMYSAGGILIEDTQAFSIGTKQSSTIPRSILPSFYTKHIAPGRIKKFAFGTFSISATAKISARK